MLEDSFFIFGDEDGDRFNGIDGYDIVEFFDGVMLDIVVREVNEFKF